MPDLVQSEIRNASVASEMVSPTPLLSGSAVKPRYFRPGSSQPRHRSSDSRQVKASQPVRFGAWQLEMELPFTKHEKTAANRAADECGHRCLPLGTAIDFPLILMMPYSAVSFCQHPDVFGVHVAPAVSEYTTPQFAK